ncbi:metallophosphoesterase [Chenggangzhangella methanolivorans]|uniref:Metallophosphoesterase n=1 Tax=Chenggangzhangella methanolivorans TaxID=1437009 RepID=A0A9E6ULT9_9HYPH|nr:metallophosphoesterase [Chenggangzhangella methanolivorans]QZN99340.1 metallophosphoesterase [Chenggangzhangella methanolivorans]
MTIITRRTFLAAGAAGFVASATGGAYAGVVEPTMMLGVTTYELTPPGWPDDLLLNVAVISDVHVNEPYTPMSRVKRIVEIANGLKPDMIVHLGDHEATHRFVKRRVPPREWAAAYADLAAPLGLWTVLGNHDWWNNSREIRRALDDAHIRVLENEAELLEHGARRFWIAGLGDQIAYRLGRGSFHGRDDLPGTLAQIRTDDPVLMLAHEPDIFAEMPPRVSLTLSGHTHGGQVYIPGLPAPWIPSGYGDRYRYGHIVEDGRHLIVSGGIGMSGLPIRFGVPPEVLMVRLGRPIAAA